MASKKRPPGQVPAEPVANAVERAPHGVLDDSARQFQLLVEGVVDYAIYLLDPKGIVTSWNPGAERIKGYARNEIIGRHFSVFYTAEDNAAAVPQKALATARETGRYEAEGWRVRKDGTRLWVNAIIDAIRGPKGELLGFAKITRDMTERRKTEAELAQAREQLFQIQKLEALGQLTGGVAHDFNNLLTIITGNIEIAQRALESGGERALPQLRRLLSNAHTGAKRAATLTQRLLAFARRQPLDPKPLNVNRFIAGVGEFLQRTLGEQISVEAVGGGGVWPVEADAVQLESALLNIALNARDAMPMGGKLTIETSNTFLDHDYARKNPEVVPGQYVLISITDSGAGMPPEVIARAFEPFFTTKLAGQGTGLGLSQVYGFVKQSSGHVKVYSEVDEGTTVKIYLPRLVEEAIASEAMPPEVVGAAQGETVLVAEDDEGVLDYVVDVLQSLDYRVMRAASGLNALKYLGNPELKIDMLLTDVVMPVMNGRVLAEEARRLRPKIKVLFMTGYSQNAIVHQGRLDPGVQLIQKPISQAQLATKIRDVMEA
jgi:PAS domain S-box-containing protein